VNSVPVTVNYKENRALLVACLYNWFFLIFLPYNISGFHFFLKNTKKHLCSVSFRFILSSVVKIHHYFTGDSKWQV